MRGIVLAGGTGSRLGHLTRSCNKHLLPVGSVPMIFHPIRVLLDNGIEDITVVSGPESIGPLAQLLGSGGDHGREYGGGCSCRFTYRVQDKPGGICQALLAAEDVHESVAVILGDNIFLPSPTLNPFDGADHIFLYKFPNAAGLDQFGVPVISHNSQVIKIVEKPLDPPSLYAVTGLYLFESDVFHNARTIQPGPRGEVEITDLLNAYASDLSLSHSIVNGWWGDAGTVKGLTRAGVATVAWEDQK